MKRREFIALIGGAAAAWPLGARAQERAVTLIGFMHTRSRDSFMPNLAGFFKALGEAGYVDGQNIFIDYRFVDGQYDRLPALAADLVARKVVVLIAGGGEPSPLAAKAATSTIPIVFAMGIRATADRILIRRNGSVYPGASRRECSRRVCCHVKVPGVGAILP